MSASALVARILTGNLFQKLVKQIRYDATRTPPLSGSDIHKERLLTTLL